MKSRKNPSVDVEKKRSLFLQIGVVITLALVFFAFEHKTYEQVAGSLGDVNVVLDDEVIPLTQRQNTPPPPPPSAPPEVINIVDDNVQIDEVPLESSETDESETVEIIEATSEVDEVFNFVNVENKPIFPGCEREKSEDDKFLCFQSQVQKFIMKEFVYPEMAQTMGIQGKVWVSFIIEKDGSVSDVRVERGVDKLLDDEAVRVVKRLPRFTPARSGGRSVRMTYSLPVNIKLS